MIDGCRRCLVETGGNQLRRRVLSGGSSSLATERVIVSERTFHRGVAREFIARAALKGTHYVDRNPADR